MNTIDKTLEERGARYGEFPEHAFITQELKRTLHDNINWGNLADDQKEALDMVMHKIGRILNGDPNYVDSWTDIIGYTRLVEKRLIDEAACLNAAQDKETTEEIQGFNNLVDVLNKALAANKCADPNCEACHPKVNAEPTETAADVLLEQLREILGPDVQIRRVD